MPKVEFFKPAADLLKLDVQWHDAIKANNPVKAHRILNQVLAFGKPTYEYFASLMADAYREYAKEDASGNTTKANEWRAITNELALAFDPTKKVSVTTIPKAR